MNATVHIFFKEQKHCDIKGTDQQRAILFNLSYQNKNKINQPFHSFLD